MRIERRELLANGDQAEDGLIALLINASPCKGSPEEVADHHQTIAESGDLTIAIDIQKVRFDAQLDVVCHSLGQRIPFLQRDKVIQEQWLC